MEDAAGGKVSYTYNFVGRLETRTWARLDAQGNSIITIYGLRSGHTIPWRI